MNTLMIGVSIFVCGQILLKLFIEPAIALRGVIGEVCGFTLQNQARISNLSESDEVSDRAKELASKLIASAHSILLYSFVRIVFCLPKKENILDASHSLNAIANTLQPGAREGIDSINWIQQIHEEKDNIARRLSVPTSYQKSCDFLH